MFKDGSLLIGNYSVILVMLCNSNNSKQKIYQYIIKIPLTEYSCKKIKELIDYAVIKIQISLNIYTPI